MKTLEFQTQVNTDKTLTVSPEVATELEPEQSVRVIVVISEPGETQEWAQVTAKQFLEGYAESDAIYDNL